MLAALLVAAVAGTAALLAVAALAAVHEVDRDDSAAWRAGEAVATALQAAADSLRWQPGLAGASGAGAPPPLAGPGAAGCLPAWSWTWRRDPPPGPAAWPRARATVSAQAGPARREATVALELRAEPWAAGVHVAGDVEVAAPLRLAGSGLVAGGCLRGREWVAFGEGDAPDLVHGDLWPLAAVHARGTIWAAGTEVHAGGGGWPDDGDDCTGGAPPAAVLRLPGRAWLAAAQLHAVAPGAALRDGVLDLAALAAALPPGVAAAGGACVVAAPAEGALTVRGAWPDGAPPLLLAVAGDAVVAGATSPAGDGGCRLRGALVVLGRLEVAAPLEVAGGLAAGDLRVAATTTVTVPADWRACPLPGACRPVVVGWQE